MKHARGIIDRLSCARWGAHKVFGVLLGLVVIGALLLPAAASAAECTDTWKGPAEGSWATASNWSVGHEPTASDVACIGAGKTATITTGAKVVGVLQGGGGVTLSGASLEIAGTGEASSIGSLTMGSGGTLKGPGTLHIEGTLSWAKESTFSGTGATVVNSGATVTTALTSNAHISQRRFINEGSFNQTTGTVALEEGAEFQNRGTFNANTNNSTTISGAGGSTFVNTGLLRRTSGSVTIGAFLENEGTVEIQTSGTLSLTGGGKAGPLAAWVATGTANLGLGGGSFTIAAGSSFSGNVLVTGSTTFVHWEGSGGNVGHLEVESGTIEVPGSLSVGTLVMRSSAVVTGTGTASIETTLSWAKESTFSGTGTTVIEPGATVTTGLTSSARIKKRRFVNEGAFTQTTGTLTLEEGAEFVNVGTFTANTNNKETISGSGGSSFVNEGTIRHSASTSITIGSSITSGGSVEVTAGTVFLKGGGSLPATGRWEATGAGTIVCESGAYAIRGAISGPLVIDSPASVTVEGNSARGGSVSLQTGGSLTVLEAFPIETLVMGSSTSVTGAGEIRIANSLKWQNESTMSGSGSTVLEPGATATTALTGIARIKQRRFINEGTFNQTSGTVVVTEGAEFVNGGTFTANTNNAESISGSSLFVNAGVVQKTTGTTTTEITAYFTNGGVIHELSGHLKITNPISILYSAAVVHKSSCGDPVDCATGNFTESQTDLAIGGRGVGLDLTRSYSAQAAAAGSPGIFGYGWTNSFGDHLTSEEGGARQTLTEASGGTVAFKKAGASYLAPGWSRDTLTGSTEAGFTLTLPDQTKEKFSGAGRLESVTDRNGNATTLAYNGSGQLETITDPSGRTITLAYNGEGLVEKATDPMGHVVKYAYESKSLISVTLPGESAPNWQFKYDASHRMTSLTDGRGGKTTNEYDGSNRVISQTDPAGRTLTWKYEAFHTTITNKATGAVTDEWFNSNDQPYSITRGYGTASATTETFNYTAAGLLASKTDGNGHTTSYGYDAEGNRTSERDAEGDELKRTFNGAHQVVTETRPNGEKTTIIRNAAGDPETVSRPAPESKTQTVSYEYGPHGEVKSMTEPLGHAWSYEYDKYGDRTTAIDPEGDKRTWAYDEDSRVISTVSPRGNEEGAEAAKFTTSIERDAQGRPIKITDPLGGATKYAYDADGNVESVTDPNGRKTKFTYDADNELTKVEHANKAVEETGYDGAGQVTSQTDGNKQKTTYVRNILEQPVETIDPLERKTTRTFDAAGNLKTLKDPEGRTTTYSYDKADRLKEVSYSDGITPKATFSYGNDGNLTGMTDGTGTSTYEYDQLDRLTHTKNGNGETLSWAYNLGDERVGLTYPNGKSISQAYDKAGRLESVTDWLGHTTSFAYNRDSAPSMTTFPIATGDTDEYGYDRADRMASVTMKRGAETLASLAYTRDPAGQIESVISKGLPGAETESFSYDENERLTKAGAAEYGYDAADNPTKAPGTTNAFDKAGQLETATGAAFTYDKEGERTKRTPSSGPATTYKYDQAGDLTAVERAEEGETPAIAESFGYDGTGLMTSRTVGLTTNHLVWDVTQAPEALLSDGDNSYLYGPGGLPFEQISSGEVPTYIHHDQLGSTRLLTNSSGEAAGTFTYGAYGALTGHTGSATTALGYAGQYTLGQSGLIYLRARYYDPATAQFLTLDREVASTRAPYFYANDNPVNRRDRTGETGEAVEGGCAGCLPILPTHEQGERALEALGEIGEEFGSSVSSVWSSIVGGDESSTEEADGQKAEEVSCPEETTTEIGDRQQQRDKDRALVEKERHSQSANPSDPSWPPSGSRIAKVIAVIGRLIGQSHQGP